MCQLDIVKPELGNKLEGHWVMGGGGGQQSSVLDHNLASSTFFPQEDLHDTHQYPTRLLELFVVCL